MLREEQQRVEELIMEIVVFIVKYENERVCGLAYCPEARYFRHSA